jgi:hypothetical protein
MSQEPTNSIRLSKADVQDLVKHMMPQDGFHIRETVIGDFRALEMIYCVDGISVSPFPYGPGVVEIWSHRVKGESENFAAVMGERDRLALLGEALCRFINTGGSREQLEIITKQLDRFMGPQEVQIPGYNLVSSGMNSEGVFEHLFASPQSLWAIRWVENHFVDVVDFACEVREAEEIIDPADVVGDEPNQIDDPTDVEA